MKMCKAAVANTLEKIDISGAFKRNGLTIKLDGSEDYLVSSKLKLLVWDEMKEFRSKLLSTPHPSSLKKLEELIIPPDSVKRKLNGVTEGVPPDKGEEMLGGEVTDEEWNEGKNDSESEDEGEEEGVRTTLQNEDQPQPPQTLLELTIDPELKADLECLNRIQSVITTEKKANTNLLPFLVRMENMIAGERQRRRALDKKKQKTITGGENADGIDEQADEQTADTSNDNDNNAFDLFDS